MDYIKSIRPRLGHQKILLNCAGAVIEQDGKILLQRRSDNGGWGLPGGLLELEETYAQAAIREVREETGLDCRLTAFLGRTDEESLELRFFSREELPALCFEDHRAAVADYYAGLRFPLLRENEPEAGGEEP